jgi:KDO2-lipid IV(A) lauroyltransferase
MKSLRELLEYALVVMLRTAARHVPFRVADGIGRSLGTAAFTLGIRRKVTLEHLAKAFPEQSSAQRLAIARRAYQHYATWLPHLFWIAGHSAEEVLERVRIPVDHPLWRRLREPCAVIVLSGHFGSPELMVNSIGLATHRSFLVVVQDQSNRRVNDLIDGDRRVHGNRTITMGLSVREVLTVLGEGGAVALLGDQSGSREAAVVNYFGRPVTAHRGAAAFSLKRNTPVIMVFTVRSPDGTYALELEELNRDGLGGSVEEQIQELTQRHTAILEKFVRMHPDHWLWMHKRWKHTPYLEGLSLAPPPHRPEVK